MELKDIQNIYSATFGSLNNSDKSYQAFVNLLKHLDLIDDNAYYDLKQRNKTAFNVYEFYNIPRLNYIPLFEDFFYDEERKTISDIYDKIGFANHIVFKDSDNENEWETYERTYDEHGLVKWVNGDTLVIIDNDEMANLISKKLSDLAYNLIRHDDYVNIMKGTEGEHYFDLDGLYDKLYTFYQTIAGSEPENKDAWSEYLNFVEEAEIITQQQKIFLIENYGKK